MSFLVRSNIGDLVGGCIIASAEILDPPAMTDSTINNLSITGLEDSCLINLTSTKEVKIYGIDSSNIDETQQFILVNNNTNGKKIKLEHHNNNNSSAQNRFEMRHHIHLYPGDMVVVIFSQARQRWITESRHH